MLRKVLFLSLNGLFINPAIGCYLDLIGDDQVTFPLSPPATLTIPAQVIRLSADAPADTTKPIAVYDSAPSTVYTSFKNCYHGDPYGKRPVGLTVQNTATKIYETDIPGIGVKLLYNNGESPAFGNFPSDQNMKQKPNHDPNDPMRFTFPPNGFYRIEFYKTEEHLSLSNKSGVQVLPVGDLAYNWVITPSISSIGMKLSIGRITLVSTPACTADSSKTVDFGTVTAAMLAASPVERALDFQMTCKTDYGSYSTTASITSPTASPDGKYIQVTDAAGQTEQLGIAILNSRGREFLVNGSSEENSISVNSQTPSTFNWKARLFSTGKGATQPRGGPFTARAEILIQLK